ncbi:hypothetical protein THIOKS11020014 [Thiocapsa sp. KS1]|nr:hypothetical protein [Thiocapsa sp. KS1]CRI62877.1 hypothetical protein THIOKS11020014 [Thiocapsa sp. KS1]
MKKMIEGKFRADAKARQVSGLNGVAEKPRSDQVIGTAGEAREKIAKAIGIGSSASMERAERVVENGRGRESRPLEGGQVTDPATLSSIEGTGTNNLRSTTAGRSHPAVVGGTTVPARRAGLTARISDQGPSQACALASGGDD